MYFFLSLHIVSHKSYQSVEEKENYHSCIVWFRFLQFKFIKRTVSSIKKKLYFALFSDGWFVTSLSKYYCMRQSPVMSGKTKSRLQKKIYSRISKGWEDSTNIDLLVSRTFTTIEYKAILSRKWLLSDGKM